MKNPIIEKITQLFLIVFSVVLGLYLSERIEDRKNEKEATLLLSKIKSELNDNIKILEIWVPYHREILGSLDSLSTNKKFIEDFIIDKSTLFETVLTRGTFMGRSPSNDAWDIAKSHPLIVNFEYDELLLLSKIYNQQKSTFEPSSKISEIFFSNDFNTKENAGPNLLLFKNLMHEIVGRESDLMNYYNEAEKILKFRSI